MKEIADQLWAAKETRIPVDPPSTRKLSHEDAYRIQLMNVEKELNRGKKLVGYKIGLTSKTAQAHFGISEPDFGHLFDDMQIKNETVALSSLIQPKIEGEFAFVLGKDLKGPGLSVGDLIPAIDCVVLALEIIDSRIRDWKISAVDTIADNASSAFFVLGNTRKKLDDLDLVTAGMALSKNGEVQTTGAGAAVMGHPLKAVVFLANTLAETGVNLRAGQVILSGAVSEMLPMQAGDVFECQALDLGKIRVRCH